MSSPRGRAATSRGRAHKALPLAALNAAVLVCALTAAGQAPRTQALAPQAQSEPQPAASAAAPSAPPAVTEAVVPAVPTATPSEVPAVPAPVNRAVVTTGWAPYATVGPVTLHFPGEVVEAVGLHQSGHDGAQPQHPVAGPAPVGRMESRQRDTHEQGAADIVVDPEREVRSPVTGTVLRAGTYALYCDHVDHYLVVEPDARPGWEVKLLHFEGLAVGKGDRVRAGVSVVGSRARVLPFSSQVDKHTVAPHWPHLHVEVVDPSVPDRPSGGTCD